jgi:Pyridoxamine 5'-phosphate oxidase
MAVLETEPGLLEALRGEMTPKFLATRSPEGMPNVVPCVTMLPADDQPDTLFFGNFLLRKSIRNLESDHRLAVLVITPELQGWILKGDFVEFQRTGPYFERQMSGGLLRYNAYTGIRNAGVIRALSLEGRFRISKVQVLLDYIRARLRGLRASQPPQGMQTVQVPAPTQREFARMAAVKVLAWIGPDGYPALAPALSMQPAGERALVAWLGKSDLPRPPAGASAATNILTFEAISYQAKGTWQPSGGGGLLQVQEVYAGGPPYPGGRVA